MTLLAVTALLFGAGQEAPSFVDRHVEARLGAVKPAGPCDEGEFLRRLALDLTGVVPKVEDLKTYLARPDRTKEVDKLLASDGFDAWWARFLIELVTPADDADLYGWLKGELKRRRPYQALVRDLITAEGNSLDTPAVNFLLRYLPRLQDVTGVVGTAFLGTNLRCAECHRDPSSALAPQDFWGLAAFFARARSYRATAIGEDDPYARTFGVVEQRRGGWVCLPKTDSRNNFGGCEPVPVPPDVKPVWVEARWLGAAKPTVNGGRQEFADFLVADPRFARNLVNRVWARLMGRGLQEPLDGLGGKIKPSHPELLEDLAGHFVKTGYDLRATIRLIVLSKAYQRSCRSDGSDPRLFAHAALRPLSAEQMAASLAQIAGRPVPSALFGPAQSLRQVHAMLQHPDVEGLIQAGAERVLKDLPGPVAQGHFEYVYLSVLSRPPSEPERKELSGKTTPEDLRDVFWALINSLEFKYNH